MAVRWLSEVPVTGRPADPLLSVFADDRRVGLEQVGADLREALAGRRIININSTPTGGGVAELLNDLLPYINGAGIDCRWWVIGGDPEFFTITKRIHNRVYGFAGDDGALDDRARQHYETVQRRAAAELPGLLRPDDVVLVHDPQPLGLAPVLRSAGVATIWRCHIGADTANAYTDEAWAFLRPYLSDLDGYVFSRAAFAPGWLPAERITVIPPAIDPLSPKNQPMSPATAGQVLTFCGLRQGDPGDGPVPFRRRDGRPGTLRRRADVLQSGPPAPQDVPLVVQISRWDPMKDMAGVMTAFADNLDELGGSHLALIGPAVTGYADDPTGASEMLDCLSAWRRLPYAARERIHLACLSMFDYEENAFVVNAIQRSATVVTQKSLAEGFGLTVAETMWKGRPVVATAVGGIQEQITPGTGVLVDPADLDGFATAVANLVTSPELLEQVGAAAHARIRDHFLPDRHLTQFARLVMGVIGGGTSGPDRSVQTRIHG
jgi:trehalose synthase